MENKLLKPQKLQKGDTIGIISPAGNIKNEKSRQKVMEYFEKKGYKVKIAPHAWDKKGYLAGEDKNRAADLENFFENSSIKAILCSRGGYGSYRILNKLDYNKIIKNPKIFVGFSDITALLIAFYSRTGLVGFHGPLCTVDFAKDDIDTYTETNFFNILENNINIPYKYKNPFEYKCINPGKVKAPLIPANIAILTGLLGTPYFPNLKGKILLLEDIGEPVYKIDRMLTQLKLSGVMDELAGLLFGEFSGIDDNDNEDVPILELIKEFAFDLNIPVGYGFPSGHGKTKATLPVGCTYYLNTEDFELSITENFLNCTDIKN